MAEHRPHRDKIALGILSLNIQSVAGDPSSSQRYCTQVVAPLLNWLAREDWLRFSFAVAGCELEFLALANPPLIDRLRELTEAGRIELISPLYTPGLWWQFSGVDLDRSVALNRGCLERLGLKTSRVFFARGLFGLGLRRLTDSFEALVCRDDHLAAFLPDAGLSPAYGLGGQTVLLAANRILHSVSCIQ